MHATISIRVRSFMLPMLILSVCTVLLCSCDKGSFVQFGGYAQGGTWGVKADLKGVDVPPQEIQSKIEAILEEIDTTLSGYNKKSLLSRFNAGERIHPTPMFLEIYAYAYDFWKETEGAMDCASGPLFDIWGFGFKTDSLPSSSKVEATMKICGMHRLPPELKPDAEGYVQSDGAVLNYNAIAQGYSCDKVAAYLHSIGVHNMLVDIGEIYCEGLNQSGKPWRVGVDRPRDGNDTPGADLDGIWESSGGPGCGVVTSGNYRKFYIKDGVKYSHTIDPRNGRPVEHNLLSATIIAPTAMNADAYANYCMVVGMEQAKAFIISRPDLEGYLIFGNNDGMEEWASPGFKLVKN